MPTSNVLWLMSVEEVTWGLKIAKISFANELYGNVGSNTHLGIFAKKDAIINWTPRGSYEEGDRNQLICDLVKTYNNF